MDSLISHKSNEPREMRKTADSVFDRIYKFYFNRKTNILLTKKEEEARERWDFAWKMLAGMYTRRQVVEGLIQKFNIQKSVAYDDISNAMNLFGNPKNANKEAKRILAEEWLIKGIKKAWDDQDLDAYERMIARFNKLNGLEETNNSEVADTLKRLQPTKITFTLTMEELKREADQLTQDVDFEDVK